MGRRELKPICFIYLLFTESAPSPLRHYCRCLDLDVGAGTDGEEHDREESVEIEQC